MFLVIGLIIVAVIVVCVCAALFISRDGNDDK